MLCARVLRFWARRTRLHPREQSLKENTDDYAPRAQKFSGLPIYNEAQRGRRPSPDPSAALCNAHKIITRDDVRRNLQDAHGGWLCAARKKEKKQQTAPNNVGLGLFCSGMHSSLFMCISSELRTQSNNGSA